MRPLPTESQTAAPNPIGAGLAGWVRGAMFLLFWLVLTGANPKDLPPGLAASAVAAWISLRLMPVMPVRIKPLRLPAFCVRFIKQSVSAGIDIARRVFDPALPLHPGVVACRLAKPARADRQAFCTLLSLQPGTLPLGYGDDGSLLLHCLDATQPVAQQVALEENQWEFTFGRSAGHD
jgi:multicomponent Na+:H+ antiporter subunit E